MTLKKKEMAMRLVMHFIGKVWGNRGYLMPIIFDVNDIWIAPNKIFYTTANAVQMRGKTFLTQNGMKYMGSYELNVNDQK